MEVLERPSAPAATAPERTLDALLKTGDLPTRVSAGVSRWMTWGFVAMVFALPLAQISRGIESRRPANRVGAFRKAAFRKQPATIREKARGQFFGQTICATKDAHDRGNVMCEHVRPEKHLS